MHHVSAISLHANCSWLLVGLTIFHHGIVCRSVEKYYADFGHNHTFDLVSARIARCASTLVSTHQASIGSKEW